MYTNGLKDRYGSPLLSKRDADKLYMDKTGMPISSYDWTPDLQNNIKLTVSTYTFPVNGWLVSRDWQYLMGNDEIRINGLPVGQVNPDGNFSLLVKKDDILTIGNEQNEATFWFLPCKSEQNDYRVTHTEYDIWKGAVTTDDNGTTVVQNLYCPNASGWITDNYNIANTITRVEDEVAYNGDTFVCNIQSSEIVNGGGMMGSILSLTTWDSDLHRLENGSFMFYNTMLSEFSSDLNSLTDGSYMFNYCPKLSTFTSNLSSLTNGGYMFMSCSNLSTFTSDLSSLTNGEYMFSGCRNLTEFTSDLSSLTNGSRMFQYNNLASFNSNLSSLTDGYCMFYLCGELTSFNSDLSSLTDGTEMFSNCGKLESVTSDLSSLTDGNRMFYETNLKQFVLNLPSLKRGNDMFSYCENLSEFTSDLSSLTNGEYMFCNCTNLTTFNADLSSLTEGYYMFDACTNLELFDWRGGKNITKSSLYDNGISFINCPLNHVSVKNVIDMYTSSDNIVGTYNMYTIRLYANKNSYKTFEYLSGLMNYDFSGLEYHTLIQEMENAGNNHLSFQYVKNGLVTIEVFFVDKPYNEVIYGDNMLDGCLIESPVDDFQIDMTNSKVKSAYRMFADAGVSDTPPLILGNGGSATFNLSVNGSLNNLENAEEMFAVSDDYFGWKDSQGQCNVSVKLNIQPFSSDNPCKMTNVNNMFDGQTVVDRCTFDAISNIANYCFTQSDVFLGKLLFVGEEQLADRNLDECVYCSLTSCLENLNMLFAEFGWKVKSNEHTDTLNLPGYIFNLYKVNEFGKTVTIKVYILEDYIYR